MVIDIDAAHSDMAVVKLAEVPGTVRSRVLFWTGTFGVSDE